MRGFFYKGGYVMTYDEAKELALKGQKIRRRIWNTNKHIFFVTSNDLANAFGYGTGEAGDSCFIGKYVLSSPSKNLHIGWRPSKTDRSHNDWEIYDEDEAG